MLSAAGKSGSCPGGNSAGHVLRLRTAAMVARPGAAAGENCGVRRVPVRSAAVGFGASVWASIFAGLCGCAPPHSGGRDRRPERTRVAASDARRCGPPLLGPGGGVERNCAGPCGCAPQWSGCGETCGSSGREFQRPTRAGVVRRRWDELSVRSTYAWAVRGPVPIGAGAARAVVGAGAMAPPPAMVAGRAASAVPPYPVDGPGPVPQRAALRCTCGQSARGGAAFGLCLGAIRRRWFVHARRGGSAPLPWRGGVRGTGPFVPGPGFARGARWSGSDAGLRVFRAVAARSGRVGPRALPREIT